MNEQFVEPKRLLFCKEKLEFPGMPKVSVIIPTHNRAEFLRLAITSVIDQTFKDWEIIVVDDHSTDNTPAVVESFADERIKYLKNRGKNGPSISRNLAISSASGEYIAFLDDDDEWLLDKLQRQIEVLDKSRSNICGVHSNLFMIEKMTGNIIPYDPGTEKLKGNLLHQLAICCPLVTPTVLIKKRCLDEVGLFDETISYMEDRDLWIRLSMKWDFEYISKPLAKIYLHNRTHLSQDIEAQISGKEILYVRYPHIFQENRKRWSEYLLTIGLQYCQLKKMSEGRRNIIKSIKFYPFKAIAYLHLFASLLTPCHYKHIRKFYKSEFN